MNSSSEGSQHSSTDSASEYATGPDLTQNMGYVCALCQKNMGPDKEAPEVWHQVTGWVGGPKKDSMRLREHTGRLAHEACVMKLVAGQAVDQESLFDADEEVYGGTDTSLPGVFGE